MRILSMIDCKSGRRSRNRVIGASLLELLVAILIMGVAMAGMSEAILLSSAWTWRLHNRFDNYLAAKSFITTLQHELRHCFKFVAASENTIEFECYTVPDWRIFDPIAEMPQSTTIRYQILPDADDPGYFVIFKSSGSSAPVKVLSGIVGPTGVQGGRVFSFLIQTANSQEVSIVPSDDDLKHIASVAVTLELKRLTFSKQDIAGSNSTQQVIKSEIYLRNLQ